MYDVNPLGPLMHLRELERHASRTHRGMPKEDHGKSFSRPRLWLAALVKQLRAAIAHQVSAE